MKRILIKELNEKFIGNTVKLQGWIKTVRRLGKITFMMVRDRSGIVQVVYEGDKVIPLIAEEAAISITGKVIQEERAPGGIEVHTLQEGIELLSGLVENLPFEVKKADQSVNPDKLYNHRALSLRNQKLYSIFLIQSALMNGFRQFLMQEGFTEISTPKIVASGTEGGTELFSVDYFEQKVYLAQSPQFYKQMMVGAGYERVFEVGKAYRAEKHDTSRHINEYVSLDFEMGFIENYQEIMDMETRLLSWLLNHLSLSCPNSFNLLGVSLPTVPEKIPAISVEQARDILKEKFTKQMPASGPDPAGERLLSKWASEELNSEWLFITGFPSTKRPFYTMFDPVKRNITWSFDLLFRGIEVTTGGQRIHDYHMLTDNMVKFGLNPEDYTSYLDIFKYGMPPHGGLAIGLERLTMKLCGLSNVREASLFPRDRNRLIP